MSNNREANSPTSSQVPRLTREETADANDVLKNPLLSSSILDELRRDDISVLTYSYRSTISSNQTTSNLVGPGRLLGNFYSWAGCSLERRLKKVVFRAGIGSNARAVIMLQKESEDMISDKIGTTNERVVEKFCKAILVCAQYAYWFSFVSLCVANS